MEGTLRFDQEKDDWFVDYSGRTKINRFRVVSDLCPGKYPTDILNHDGTTVDFDLSIKEGQYITARINNTKK